MTLLSFLKQIPDTRRGQGKLFDQAHILLFCILAIMTGADSYRKMGIFIEEHFAMLMHAYGLKWKRPPSYNTLRHVIHSLDTKELEKTFRAHAKTLSKSGTERPHIGLDGKALKHSFDTVEDTRFRQILSAFSTLDCIILAHEDSGESKENEINSAIRLLKDLGISRALYTLDALHTQKTLQTIVKLKEGCGRDAPSERQPTYVAYTMCRTDGGKETAENVHTERPRAWQKGDAEDIIVCGRRL